MTNRKMFLSKIFIGKPVFSQIFIGKPISSKIFIGGAILKKHVLFRPFSKRSKNFWFFDVFFEKPKIFGRPKIFGFSRVQVKYLQHVRLIAPNSGSKFLTNCNFPNLAMDAMARRAKVESASLALK